MRLSDIEAYAKALTPVILRCVEARESKIRADFEAKMVEISAEMAEKLAELPEINPADIAAEAALMVPEPKAGEDGKSVTVEDVEPMLRQLVAEAVGEIPPPEAGPPGEKGEKGEKGESISVEEVRELVSDAVKTVEKSLSREEILPDFAESLRAELACG